MKYELVPVGEDAKDALDKVLDVFSRSGVSLRECLNNDASALCASDMLYFPPKYYGKVPSYATFLMYLNKLPADIKDQFNETIAEVESGRYIGEMDEIAHDTDEETARFKSVKFDQLKKLSNIYEKRLERIDRRRKDRGDAEAKGVDMAARLISALSNADLVKLKNNAETIDAEIEAREVVDNG